jgi:hypothetical protein
LTVQLSRRVELLLDLKAAKALWRTVHEGVEVKLARHPERRDTLDPGTSSDPLAERTTNRTRWPNAISALGKCPDKKFIPTWVSS